MCSLFKALLILLFISNSINLNAQVTITLDSITGQNVTGSQIIIDTIPTNSISLPHLYITNNSGLAKNWLITRKNISQPNNWFNYLCWGGLCYGTSALYIWSTSQSTTINNAASEELSIYIGAPTSGSAHYRYYISSDGSNFIDSVDIIVNAILIVGTHEIAEIETLLFPNPVRDKIILSGFPNSSYNLKVFDYSGRQVINENNLTSNEIDVSDLTNGHYVFVIKNNETYETYKQQVIVSR